MKAALGFRMAQLHSNFLGGGWRRQHALLNYIPAAFLSISEYCFLADGWRIALLWLLRWLRCFHNNPNLALNTLQCVMCLCVLLHDIHGFTGIFALHCHTRRLENIVLLLLLLLSFFFAFLASMCKHTGAACISFVVCPDPSHLVQSLRLEEKTYSSTQHCYQHPRQACWPSRLFKRKPFQDC